jgi:hypothetical protein
MKTNKFLLVMLILELMGCGANLRVNEEKTDSGIKIIYKPKDTSFSSNRLIVIPTRPEVTINKETSILLIKFLSRTFRNKEICVQIDTNINFVDCGENFEKVICPKCEKEIAINYWQEIMDKASKTNFSDMTFKTNCCSTVTDLNSLKYIGDCGFSKYSITIYDPEYGKFEESKLLLGIKNICQSNFKLIFSHI